MLLLGIETSCDETAAAVVQDGCEVVSSVLFTQDEIHSRFGGIVPELACRRHSAVIDAVVEGALLAASVDLRELSGIAVTRGPGLMGALLVGVSYAKALAYSQGLPLIGVDHLAGHLSSVRLGKRDVRFPAVGLVVSGGHTNLYRISVDGSLQLLGRTLDDAAGEAFDKGAKMLGLPFPGGPALDRLSETGDPARIRFPRPSLKNGRFDMSFSGLKTSLRYYLDKSGHPESDPAQIPDVAAAYQQAIVDVLVEKTLSAALRYSVRSVFITGGVAANRLLRKEMERVCREHKIHLIIPSPPYCTDNGAMIAAAGFAVISGGGGPDTDLEMSPYLKTFTDGFRLIGSRP